MARNRTTTTARRRKGEGGIDRHHEVSRGCPPVGEDGTRPDHDCKRPYRARVWVTTSTGGRKRVPVYGASEAEVLVKIKALHVSEAKGEVVADTALTVAQWMSTANDATGWWAIARPTLKVNTRKGYVSKVNTYIVPHIGHRKLNALQPEHVRGMYDAMRKDGLSEASCLGVHRVLRRALKVAMREGKVARNVCDLIDPPKASKGKGKARTALTVEEAWQVLRTAGDNPRPWVALLTGLRQGEALALRWSNVVLASTNGEVPHLVVAEALSRETGVGLVFDTPKSPTSTDRVVPLLAPVAARLAKHRLAERQAGRGGDNDLVFPNPRTGGPMDARRDWFMWTTLLDVAGVEHIRLHAARNTTSRLLQDAGVDTRVVADILGHAQVQMTQHYQKGNMPAVRKGMAALEAHLEANGSAA